MLQRDGGRLSAVCSRPVSSRPAPASSAAPQAERFFKENTEPNRSRPGVIRTHDQGIMRTKAADCETTLKTAYFIVSRAITRPPRSRLGLLSCVGFSLKETRLDHEEDDPFHDPGQENCGTKGRPRRRSCRPRSATWNGTISQESERKLDLERRYGAEQERQHAPDQTAPARALGQPLLMSARVPQPTKKLVPSSIVRSSRVGSPLGQALVGFAPGLLLMPSQTRPRLGLSLGLGLCPLPKSAKITRPAVLSPSVEAGQGFGTRSWA